MTAVIALRQRPTRPPALPLTAGCAALLVVLLCTSVSLGSVALTPFDAFRIILGHLLPGMPWMTDGTYTALQDQAVWEFRLPRALLAATAGASLALAGAILQAVVHNPLAEPAILSVSSGAGVGAVTVVVLGTSGTISISGAAFVGAALATITVFLVARKDGVIAPQRLILAGVALGTLFSAVTSFLTLTTEAQNVFSLMYFLLGSVSAATMSDLVAPLVALVVGIVVAALSARSINALLAGDDAATALGVPVNALRTTLLLVSALLTGSVVAVAGGIGFVGLIIPHIARMTVGADSRRMLPLTVVAGAMFPLVADVLARVVAEPAEIPLGILTAVVGAPFFLWLMRGNGAERQWVSR